MPVDDLVDQLGPLRRQLRPIRRDLLLELLVLGGLLVVLGLGRLARGDVLLRLLELLRALVDLDPALEHPLGLLGRVVVLPLGVFTIGVPVGVLVGVLGSRSVQHARHLLGRWPARIRGRAPRRPRRFGGALRRPFAVPHGAQLRRFRHVISGTLVIARDRGVRVPDRRGGPAHVLPGGVLAPPCTLERLVHQVGHRPGAVLVPVCHVACDVPRLLRDAPSPAPVAVAPLITIR